MQHVYTGLRELISAAKLAVAEQKGDCDDERDLPPHNDVGKVKTDEMVK